MAQFIINKGAAYNIYSTIGDGPLFEKAVSPVEIRDYIQSQYGAEGVIGLERRITRARLTGTSEIGCCLHDTICCNRAGEEERKLSDKEFIDRFLTISDHG